ncbi:MAG: hypothetical protein Q4P66_03075 [Actinomycetaceae bacterium]|nr:hypothetical protein [Actinomycetaceae bacterium]
MSRDVRMKVVKRHMYLTFQSQRVRARERIRHRRWLIRRNIQRIRHILLLPVFVGRAVIVLAHSVFAYLFKFLHFRQHYYHHANMASVLLSQLLEDMQRAYFRAPWLSDVTIALIEGVGKILSIMLRSLIIAGLQLRIGDSVQLQRRLRQVPVDGYQMAMGVWLAWGEAAGYFRAQSFFILPVMKSGRLVDPSSRDYPLPQLRRYRCPLSVADALLDIEDVYWNANVGAPVKVIRIGDDSSRARRVFFRTLQRFRHRSPRWIVVLAGTDHLEQSSTTNPADSQSNLHECLHQPSLMRQGVHAAVLEAMKECGITTPEQMANESVMIIGHSQGAMIAMALANDPDVAYNIRAIVSAGGPIGRFAVPDNTTIMALRHRQDAITALGGFQGEFDPRITVMERSLEMPQSSALYYAHAASTYAETARLTDRIAQRMPDSPIGRAMNDVNDFFPEQLSGGKGSWTIKEIYEPSRVFIYEVIQECGLPEERQTQ